MNRPRHRSASGLSLMSWRACRSLPQLHTAITEARKSRNPVVLGFQGKAQLEYLYGHLAEVMLSQPATSVWLTTKEPKAGNGSAKFIGKVEVERLRETHFDGTRSGRNFALDRQVEPLVLESEISGLRRPPRLHEISELCHSIFVPVLRICRLRMALSCASGPTDKLPYDRLARAVRAAEPAAMELRQAAATPPIPRNQMGFRRSSRSSRSPACDSIPTTQQNLDFAGLK